ncbi:MAG: M16 family metallopeptidase [Gammaproteobacteria bacterium]
MPTDGIELALLPRPKAPVMTLTLLWQGGALTDPTGLGGAAALTAELLAKGTRASDAVTLASRIEALGAELDTWAGRESLGLSLTGPGQVFDRLWPIVREILWTPRFDRREFQKTRLRAIESIRAAKDGDPRSLLPLYADGWIYGTAHPCGHPIMGDERSLAAIPARLLKETWQRHRIGARTLVSVVGDFDPRQVEAELRSLLVDSAPVARRIPPAPVLATAPVPARGILIDRPGASQGYFWIGGLGTDREHVDWVGLELVHAALGGRFNSLINRRLRVERGLTYGAHSGYTLPGFRGLSYLTSYTPTETTGAAIEASLEVLGEAHEKGFPVADLEAARRYLTGQEVFRYETSGQLAHWLRTVLLYGRDVEEWEHYPERLNAVTTSQAKRILNEVFPAPKACQLVVIGDAERLLPRLTGFGEWVRYPIASCGFGPPEGSGIRIR